MASSGMTFLSNRGGLSGRIIQRKRWHAESPNQLVRAIASSLPISQLGILRWCRSDAWIDASIRARKS